MTEERRRTDKVVRGEGRAREGNDPQPSPRYNEGVKKLVKTNLHLKDEERRGDDVKIY
jgi:hypothetical protein